MMLKTVTVAEVHDEEEVQNRKSLAYLDWFEALLIGAFVYCALQTLKMRHDELESTTAYDDHAFKKDGAGNLGLRWVSVLRQWLVPMFFFVFGAKMSVAFATWPQTLLKWGGAAALGLVLNYILWLEGPQDPTCDPAASDPYNRQYRQTCKGPILPFTVTPMPKGSEWWSILYQISFLVMLIGFLVLNVPLFNFIANRGGVLPLVIQWVATIGFYVAMVLAAGSRVPYVPLLISLLLVYEAAFLAVAALSTPRVRPHWLPARVVHYLAGGIAILIFGCTPIATSMSTDISPAYILFLTVGSNKIFQLGYVITQSRRHDNVEPILSKFWPLTVAVMVLCAPSTNWFLAGNLAFPYFPSMLDRSLFVTGTVVMVFIFERIGASFPLVPFPSVCTTSAVVLYLLYPHFMAFWIVVLPRNLLNVEFIWWCCIFFAAAFAALLGLVQSVLHRKLDENYDEDDDEEDYHGAE